MNATVKLNLEALDLFDILITIPDKSTVTCGTNYLRINIELEDRFVDGNRFK